MSRRCDFDPEAYGPAAAELLVPTRLPELGPGTPNPAAREHLAALTPEGLLAPRTLVDPDMARACIAGLWLCHDFLDESHRISQTIDSPTGSYWHGIMHRREPDFENSKYWFRRVGSHPIFTELAQQSRNVALTIDPAGKAIGFLAEPSAPWEPFAFIDACRHCLKMPGTAHELCRRISLLEWQLLFDYSYRAATGTI